MGIIWTISHLFASPFIVVAFFRWRSRESLVLDVLIPWYAGNRIPRGRCLPSLCHPCAPTSSNMPPRGSGSTPGHCGREQGGKRKCRQSRGHVLRLEARAGKRKTDSQRKRRRHAPHQRGLTKKEPTKRPYTQQVHRQAQVYRDQARFERRCASARGGTGHGTGSRGPHYARKRAPKNDYTDALGAPTRYSNALKVPPLRNGGQEAADPPS